MSRVPLPSWRASRAPEVAKAALLDGVRAFLPDDVVDRHFTPTYRPWRQRVALVPDGDLFQGIAAGKTSVVTGAIARFTDTGILLDSGQHLEADIVVTATGMNLNVMGDIEFVVDGKPLVFSDCVTYHGMMFTGVPNMVWIFGYLRSAWTLRVDLVADFLCSLLKHMQAKGYKQVSVVLRAEDEGMALSPFVDPEDFNPGYILLRALHVLPQCGDKPEWRHSHDYEQDAAELPAIDLEDTAFVYL